MSDPMLDAGFKYSIATYELDGVQTQFEFNFSGGYIRREHIKAYTRNALGVNTDLPAGFTWIGPNTIEITPALAASKGTLFVYRDTPKDVPIVDFTDGAIINEKNLDTMSQQSIFGAGEVIDRFADVNQVSILALATANAAVVTADATTAVAAAAVTTAEAAETKADAAVVTANSAQTAAAAAVTTANSANATALGIDGKAQEALDNSEAAVTTADEAKTTADGLAASIATANSNASAAVTTANAASTTAGGAVTTANTAKSTADGLAASIATANSNASAAVTTAGTASSDAAAAVAAVASKLPIAGHYYSMADMVGLTAAPANGVGLPVNSGRCADDTGTVMLVRPTLLTKTSAAWAAGNAGVLDTGTIAPGTWYKLFIIGKADGTTDFICTLPTNTTPLMPSGYIYKRRIAMVVWSSSNYWIKYWQRGDEFLWDVPFSNVVGTIINANVRTGFTFAVPPNLEVEALLSLSAQCATASAGVRVDNPSVTALSDASSAQIIIPPGGGWAGTHLRARTNVAQQLTVIASANSTAIYMACFGFIDRRQRDGGP